MGSLLFAVKDDSMRLTILGCALVLGCVSVSLADEVNSKVSHGDDQVKPLAVVQQLDPALPEYRPQPEGVGGELVIECSHLTKPLVSRWATAFQAIHPEAKIIAEPHLYGGYLGTIVLAFEGSGATFDVREQIHEDACTWPVVVGLDRLEVIVHRSNAIKKLSVDEVAWVMSDQGKSYSSDSFDEKETVFLDHPRIDDWNELWRIRTPEFASPQIRVYRRTSLTQDDQFLMDQTVGYTFGTGLFAQRWRREDAEIVETADQMVQAVTNDQHGIGYVSHSLLTDGVRPVPLEGKPNDMWHSKDKKKPQPYLLELPVMVRPLYLLVPPGNQGPQPKLRAEFLKFILSKQGQAAVVEEGFFPLPAPTATRQIQAAMGEPAP